jgi:acylphosphatase
MKHVTIQVCGDVQGVFYRQSTRQKARELDIAGWVENKEDGSVHIEAEGEEEQLRKLIQWCWQGPPASSVTRVDHEFSNNIEGHSDFSIKF